MTSAATTTVFPTTVVYYPPIADINGVGSISKCGRLDLNALGSRDSSGEPLRYIWTVESVGESDDLRTSLEAINGRSNPYMGTTYQKIIYDSSFIVI